ncbi:GNAT family N-acetyltransferase [Hyalangium ruber]|uniref:GNAT family N-acetyltransferase n=1 Tax=Hyalangium rubrum TaxID=3103134 RepID=A0ABU5HE57_9BACT|nr:GNAT family N-acetyltransferase [Hyalangium sp. s54d21]MDY7231399.1 GNAT family N-acetyltransferase [Hyalangium sp. s54d21]
MDCTRGTKKAVSNVRYAGGMTTPKVVRYEESLREHFARLNRQWIEQDFALEEADLASFADPHRAFVAGGGEVFFALHGGQVLGTCALRREDADTFELCKMAVAPEARGLGLGDALMEEVLRFARERHARRVYLVSNTKLAPAIGLYRKHGFVTTRTGPEVSREAGYARADIEMVLTLRPEG